MALFLKHLSLQCDSLLQYHSLTDQQCMGQRSDGRVRRGLSRPPWAPLASCKRGIVQHFGAAVVGSGSEMPHKGTCLFLCSYREGSGRIRLHESLQASLWKTARKQNSKEKNSHKILPRPFHQIHREGPTECPKHVWTSTRREHFQEKGLVQQSLFSQLHQQTSHKGHSSSTNLLSSG